MNYWTDNVLFSSTLDLDQFAQSYQRFQAYRWSPVAMKDWKLGATIAIVITHVSALCRFLYQNLDDFLQIATMQAPGICSNFLEKTKMIFINLLIALNAML